MKQIEKFLNIGFLAALALFLLVGLGKTVFRPKEINDYENREANVLHRPTVETFLNTSFQDSVEDALSDQVLMALTFKRLYNEGSSGFLYATMWDFLQNHPEKYVSLDEMQIFGSDYLVYSPYLAEVYSEYLEKNVAGFNKIIEEHFQLDFYGFYIEKDSDVNFETGERAGISEYVERELKVPSGHFGCFSIDNFSQYKDYFYHTDHHWNHKGSYLGYTQAAELLGVDEPLMKPAEELILPSMLNGSKAGSTGAAKVFSERFAAYRFDFPEMKIQINGREEEDYGNQARFLADPPRTITYGGFYGPDSGEVIFDTGRTDRKNILVLGESYDNAVLKLLATHFHKTFSIDLRNYTPQLGSTFSFGEYVRQNQIDMVLFIGSGSYFTTPEFVPEG